MWGANASGQLGLGNIVDRSVPVQVGLSANWKTFSLLSNTALATKTDGTLWAWGNNAAGALGLGDLVNRSSPVQVGSLTNWKTIPTNGVNESVIVIKTDGSLWSWGDNASGVLGLGNIVARSSPVQVGTLTNWKTIYSSNSSTIATKTDGSLWSWGYNFYGQLGSGTVLHRSSPVQVGSLTNWKVVYISSGYNNSNAIKTDGSLWSWGNNAYGQLGLGDVVSRSSPVQVGSLTNWKTIQEDNSLAIKTDGTLWAWGNNAAGALGLGDLVNRSSPVQVGTLTNWKTLTPAGTADSILAIKTDGTLWSWGANASGQLGLGDVIDRSSPVQVGTQSNWQRIIANFSIFAIKTDGTLWSWGNNSVGALGLGDLVNRSSPVQVGTLTNWRDLNSAGATKYSFNG